MNSQVQQQKDFNSKVYNDPVGIIESYQATRIKLPRIYLCNGDNRWLTREFSSSKA